MALDLSKAAAFQLPGHPHEGEGAHRGVRAGGGGGGARGGQGWRQAAHSRRPHDAAKECDHYSDLNAFP
jgi:hypothetical protein